MTHFIHGQVPPGCTRGLLRIVWDTLTQGPCHERGELSGGPRAARQSVGIHAHAVDQELPDGWSV